MAKLDRRWRFILSTCNIESTSWFVKELLFDLRNRWSHQEFYLRLRRFSFIPSILRKPTKHTLLSTYHTKLIDSELDILRFMFHDCSGYSHTRSTEFDSVSQPRRYNIDFFLTEKLGIIPSFKKFFFNIVFIHLWTWWHRLLERDYRWAQSPRKYPSEAYRFGHRLIKSP